MSEPEPTPAPAAGSAQAPAMAGKDPGGPHGSGEQPGMSSAPSPKQLPEASTDPQSPPLPKPASEARPDPQSELQAEPKTGSPPEPQPKPRPGLKPGDLDPEPVPRDNAAMFSTDLGRRPKRQVPGPPYPPVVVFNHQQKETVVKYAHSWLRKYPMQYHCYFPSCGFEVRDMFDDYDIHVHTPKFMEEVLFFITRDNYYRAKNCIIRWALNNEERVEYVMKHLPYEPQNPRGMVDQVFVNGEEKQFPRIFLWHAINILREPGCWSPEELEKHKQGGTAHAFEAHELHPQNQLTGQVGPGSPPVTEAQVQQPEQLEDRGARDMHSTGQSAGTIAPMPPSLPGSQNLPSGQGWPQVHTDPRVNIRSTANRQGSGSYSEAPLHHRQENLPIHPPGQRPRQTAETMTMGPSPRLRVPGPMSPPMMNPMMNPMNPMGPMGPMSPMMQYPQQLGAMPGHLPPGQMQFQPMVPGRSYQPGFHYAAPPMHPGPGQYMGGPVGPQGVPVGDMSNSAQYPFPGNLQQHDYNVNMARRGNRSDRSQGLYNPYGAERPDFANVPTHPAGRKSRRTSFASTAGRTRGQPSGPHHIPADMSYGSGQGQASEPPFLPDPRYPRKTETYPPIASDPTYGCGENWIGVNNKTVKELYVFDVPSGLTLEAVQTFFQQQAGVKPISFSTATDIKKKPLAKVTFASVAEARKGLELSNQQLLGKRVTVKVPQYYYNLQSTGSYPRGGHVSAGPSATKADTAVPGSSKPSYSPQDARSDLLPQHVSEHEGTIGSPGKRKANKQDKSPAEEVNTASKTPSELDSTKALVPQGGASHKRNGKGKAPAVVEQQATPDKGKAETTVMAKQQETVSEGKATVPVVTEPQDIPSKPKAKVKLPKKEDTVEGKADKSRETMEGPKMDLAQTETLDAGVKTTGRVDIKDTVSSEVHPAKEQDPLSQASSSEERIAIGGPNESGVPQQTEGIETSQGPLVAEQSSSKTDDEAQANALDDNEVSFHSAQEAQSDAGKDEEKDHTESPNKLRLSEVSPPADLPADVGGDQTGTDQLHSSVKTIEDAKQTSDATAGAPDVSSMPTEKKMDAKQPSEQSTGTPPANSALTEKKPGAKQTDSLFPFAKSKAQLKQEKQAKKKDKKKAKSEKSGPPPQAKGGSIGITLETKKDKETLAQDRANDVGQKGLTAVTRKAEHAGGKASDPCGDPMGKGPEVVNPGSPIEAAKQEAPKPFPKASGGAQSNERDSVDVPNKATEMSEGSANIPTSTESKQIGAPPSETASTQVATPVLKLPSKTAPPHGNAAVGGSTADSSPTHKEGKKLALKLQGTELTSSTTTENNKEQAGPTSPKSAASSSTLVPNDAAPTSPSPTAAEFHTPAQTPTTLAPTTPAPAKKSKNKKKKKKAQPTVEAGIATEKVTAGPSEPNSKWAGKTAVERKRESRLSPPNETNDPLLALAARVLREQALDQKSNEKQEQKPKQERQQESEQEGFEQRSLVERAVKYTQEKRANLYPLIPQALNNDAVQARPPAEFGYDEYTELVFPQEGPSFAEKVATGEITK